MDITNIQFKIEEDKNNDAEKEDLEKQQQLVIVRGKLNDHLEIII